MVTGTSLANQTIRILNYIDHLSPEAGDPDHDVITALYHMHNLSPTYAVITCPVRHGHFFYISENCSAIFGYSAEYMALNFRSLSQYFSQVHPEDIVDFQDCINYFKSFIQDGPPEEHHKLRAVFHYRFRNGEGEYIYLQDEKVTLITTGGKNIHYSLIRNTDDAALFTGMKIEIYRQGPGMQKLGEYKPAASRNKLSAREADLVRLIKKGLTTKEIAWQLSISHHTVRNIKSRMFEKYNVNNTIELLNITG